MLQIKNSYKLVCETISSGLELFTGWLEEAKLLEVLESSSFSMSWEDKEYYGGGLSSVSEISATDSPISYGRLWVK